MAEVSIPYQVSYQESPLVEEIPHFILLGCMWGWAVTGEEVSWGLRHVNQPVTENCSAYGTQRVFLPWVYKQHPSVGTLVYAQVERWFFTMKSVLNIQLKPTLNLWQHSFLMDINMSKKLMTSVNMNFAVGRDGFLLWFLLLCILMALLWFSFLLVRTKV